MSVGGSASENSSGSTTTRDTFIDPTQQGFLQNLWGQAAGAADPAGANASARTAQAGVLPGMSSAFTNLVGMTDPTANINAQTFALQEGLGNMFRNEIMPAIGGNAVGSGGFGGGRHGVAQGVAAGGIADAFSQGVGQIHANANQQALMAQGQLPGAAQSIFGAYQQPYQSGMEILGGLGGILGGPTVLDKMRANQHQSSSQSGFNFGLEF